MGIVSGDEDQVREKHLEYKFSSEEWIVQELVDWVELFGLVDCLARISASR